MGSMCNNRHDPILDYCAAVEFPIVTSATAFVYIDALQKVLFVLLRLRVNALVFVLFSSEAVGSC